jgi:hypothetical protein
LRRRDHLQLALGFQGLDIARLQVDDEIGVAALDQVGARRRLRYRLDDQALEEGRLIRAAAVPGLAALGGRLLARLEGLDDIGAAAGLVLLQPVQRPRIGFGRVRLGKLGIDDDGIDGREIRQRQLVRLRQRDLDGQGIDHLELVGAGHRARQELRLAQHRRGDATVE